MRYSEIRQIFKDCDLCFGNIAYCCGLRKSCPNRDECIRRLGLTKRQYSDWKRLLTYNLLTYLEEKAKKAANLAAKRDEAAARGDEVGAREAASELARLEGFTAAAEMLRGSG